MTRNKQQVLGRKLDELFGQVYARQVLDNWRVTNPKQVAQETIIQWADWCLRYHLLPEHVITDALATMRKGPLKTSDQQLEEFKGANSAKTGQPIPDNGGSNHVPASEQGDSGGSGYPPGDPHRVDAPTPIAGGSEASYDDYDGPRSADGGRHVR